MKRSGRRAACAAFVSLVSLALVTSACGEATPSPVLSQSRQVEIADFAFKPDSLTVTPDDTVTWTNSDFVPHTVTGEDGKWDSGVIAAGSTFTIVVAETTGTAYYCKLHPNMRGVLFRSGDHADQESR